MRYLLSLGVLALAGSAFPLGTLVVNTLGSFALGVLMETSLTTDLVSPTLRLALGTGFLGGFTTYSTFNYETIQYLERGAWLTGVANIVATVILCLASGLAGVFVARVLSGA